MFYNGITIVLGILALLIALLGLKMLFRTGWIAGFIRGTGGVAFIACSACAGMVAVDIYSYRQMIQDKPIATISFAKNADGSYQATLVYADNGDSKVFRLAGDQWQIDARVIRWKGLFQSVGGKPGYRLDRIGGRYLSLEDERMNERTVYSLSESEYGVDLWAWLHESKDNLPWVEASYGSATYVPMADGALFEVAISTSGLVAKPLNSSAKEAINFWH